jgi:hypothetical protein
VRGGELHRTAPERRRCAPGRSAKERRAYAGWSLGVNGSVRAIAAAAHAFPRAQKTRWPEGVV